MFPELVIARISSSPVLNSQKSPVKPSTQAHSKVFQLFIFVVYYYHYSFFNFIQIHFNKLNVQSSCVQLRCAFIESYS